jgi:tRNA threonylcarbamoyladenosine biosynthesis protein TsaB
MRLLALDTSTAICRAALLAGDEVLGEYVGARGRSQAEQLPGALLDLLRASAMSVGDVDAFAVVSGPGSFTGVRIGIATIQGLAIVTSRPVVGVSALDVLGHLGSDGEPADALVAGWIDARRGEVFSAVYRVADASLFEPARVNAIEGPAVETPEETLRGWARAGIVPAVLAGDGALPGGVPDDLRHVDISSLVVAAGRIAARRIETGVASGPADLAPLYVRRPDAILARERLGASK